MPARLLLLSGDDTPAVAAARAAVLHEHDDLPAERIDLTDDGGIALLRTALRSGGLFAARRLLDVTGFETVRADDARQLAPALDVSDAVVVARAASRPHPAVVTALGDHVEHRHLAVPSARALPGRIRQLATDAGVHLQSDTVELLTRRCRNDLGRAASVCDLLARAGLDQPQTRQVALLLGSTDTDTTPWQVTDALAADDLPGALAAADAADLQALLAYLGGFLGDVGALVEARPANVDAAAAVLSMPAFKVRSPLRLAGRLTDRQARDAMVELTRLTVDARGSARPAQVRARLAALLSRLTAG